MAREYQARQNNLWLRSLTSVNALLTELRGNSMRGGIAILLTLVLGCSVSYAEEILLSEVWTANIAITSPDMVETKPLIKLEREHSRRRGGYLDSMIFQITQTLTRDQRYDTPMRQGFAVDGDGREALEEMHAILVNGQNPPDRFPQGHDTWAVFFTRQTGYLHLMRAELAGNVITIEYCREPTNSNAIVSAKVAMIPLGKLPSGRYQVTIVGFSKKPDSQKSKCEPIRDEHMKKQVCQSFEFSIFE
jgi:hypothetical protein